ncbi:hypothetical protein [Natranaerobius thermophilus]|nr:hypothetical protein [Natranaerobius thermophilus]
MEALILEDEKFTRKYYKTIIEKNPDISTVHTTFNPEKASSINNR